MQRNKKNLYPQNPNHPIIKSIYLNYLLYSRTPRWSPDITNSCVTKTAKEEINGQSYTFEFTPKGSALALRKSMLSLENPYDPKILDWTTQFRTIAELCNWSDETATSTLKVIVSADVLPII